MNQEIEKYLRIYVNYRQSDWAEWLALAEFTHNNKASLSTSMSPFYVNTGYHPWKGIENAVESHNEATNDFAEKMKKIRDKAAAALEKTQKTMKKYYDAHRRDVPEFKVGDKVWIEGKDITTDHPTKKLEDRRLGPYEILEKVGAAAYKLRLPETDLSHPVFNESLLTPRRHLTHAKKLLDRYNVEHNIEIRTLPVLPKGFWDKTIRRYKTKVETLEYSTKKLFIPETGVFVTVDEDVDPRGGVISRFDRNLIVPTPADEPNWEDWENAG
jgi:hypothetical protein